MKSKTKQNKLIKLRNLKSTIETKLMASNSPSDRLKLCEIDTEIEKYALEQAASSIFQSQCWYANDGE